MPPAPQLLRTGALLGALLLAVPAQAQTTDDYAEEPAAEAPAQDLISRLESLGSFTVLVDALNQTGLADELRSGDTYTLFAPTDAAFQALPEGTLEALSPEDLADVLRYHLLVGEVGSAEAADLGEAMTVQGGTLAIIPTDDGLTVNGTPVSYADVEADNGVIHVIDSVLLPPSADVPADEFDGAP